MKEIPLTQGKVALVDDGDYEYLMQWKWYAVWNGTVWSAARRVNQESHRHEIKMQYQLMGRPPRRGVTIDHRDRNPFNFQRGNLRWATRAQQNANRVVANSTGLRGVYRARGKFKACVGGCGVGKRHLGTYQTAVEAARAYNTAALELYGEFACLNQIPA